VVLPVVTTRRHIRSIVEELKHNPSAIHNTKHKKKMREMMLEGKRPKECEYCWKIEDMGRDADGNPPVSDRTYKTVKSTTIADVKRLVEIRSLAMM
jgi:hypothetical protein